MKKEIFKKWKYEGIINYRPFSRHETLSVKQFSLWKASISSQGYVDYV